MRMLKEENIIRLINTVDLPKNERIERAYLDNNKVKLTVRDLKSKNIREYAINFKNEPKKLDFIINGIQLSRE